MFDRVVRHAWSEAIKLPIAYLFLLSGLILKEHPDVVKEEDLKSSLVAIGKISFN